MFLPHNYILPYDFSKKILRHLLIGTVIIGALIPFNSICQVSLNYNWSYGGSHNDGNYDSRSIEWSFGKVISVTSKVSTDGDITEFQGGQDVWLLMHDSGGNILWQKSFGGSKDEYPTDFLVNKSKELIIVGTTNSSDGHFNSQDTLGDSFIMKTDSIGNLLWVRNYGGSGLDVFTDITIDSIGNMYVVGHTNSLDGDIINNHGDLDIWVLKMDSSGGIIWNKSVGGTGREWYPNILYDSTGFILISSNSDSNDPNFISTLGYSDAVLIKIDTNGIIQWFRNYGGDLDEGAISIDHAIFGGYVFTGYTFSNNGDAGIGKGMSDLWVVKVDTNGNLNWSKRYGGSQRETGKKIISNANKYRILGNTESDNGDVLNFHFNGVSYRWDIWYLELDSVGDLLWNRCFGSNWDDHDGDFTVLSNGSNLSPVLFQKQVVMFHLFMAIMDIWIFGLLIFLHLQV